MKRPVATPPVNQTRAIADAIVAGDRRTLARAITLVESAKAADQERAEELLTLLLPRTGRSLRIGISGAPGVGKSTFIEAFGKHLTATGRRLAVFAIDPSSRRSGGSILGDKTRMDQLARDPNAYIRPSPAGTTLGGVARRTRECVLLAEAASFDVVIVETVGIGQSEIAVADMTDLFVVLVAPGGGDDLQGIKRGVMELADLLLVTKADGDLAAASLRTAADYQSAMYLMLPKHKDVHPRVMTVSALEGLRIAETWQAVLQIHDVLASSGRLEGLRMDQARRWFWSEARTILSEMILENPELAEGAKSLEDAVAAGRTLPYPAARVLLKRFAAAVPSLDPPERGH